jgi:predicted lysophospholipase L1 biosynthesis ABC-type transport system permease subunit
VPLAMQRAITPTQDVLEDRTHSWLNFFARIKPGESLARAQAAMDVAFHGILEADLRQGPAPRDPKDRQELLKSRIELRPAARGITELREKWEKPLQVLMIMVGLVLLIACANVAGLLVARGTGRQREIAIRLALGAKRSLLVKQLLLEGLLLALAGAAAGLLVEHWSTAALLSILPRDAAGGWVSQSLDLRVLGYTLALSVVCALLFALIPALQATRPNVAGTLKDQASNVLASGSSARLRRVLVTLQVALSLLLVVGAGLFSVSAANLVNANRGFRAERLWMFSVDATLIRNGTAAASAFYRNR